MHASYCKKMWTTPGGYDLTVYCPAVGKKFRIRPDAFSLGHIVLHGYIN